MKKKLFFKLFIFAVIGSLVTMTSCKDYDDDIDGLETDVAGLKTELTSLDSDISSAQKAATEALAKAQEALTAAQAAGKASDVAALQAQVAAIQTQFTALSGLKAEVTALMTELETANAKQLADIKAEVQTLSDQLKAMLGGMVTDVELLTKSPELKFSTIKEKANVFEEGIANAITFVKDKQIQTTQTFVIRVSPTNAEITPEMISLQNSEGKTYDNIEVVSVKQYDKLLTRSTNGSGLWEVTVQLKEYVAADFDAATKAGGAPILFAVAVDNTKTAENPMVRKVITDYDVTLSATSAAAMNSALYYFVDKTKVTDLQSRGVNEYKWKSTPAVEAITTGDNINVATDNEGRSSLPLYPAVQGQPIKISLSKSDYSGTPDNIRALYVTLDTKGVDQEDPSEWNAWNSYSYTGLGKVVEGTETNITIGGATAINDVIGFRVYAVNIDGTLVDPDGKAFYVSLGKEATNWNAVNTVVTATEEGTDAIDVKSALANVSLTKLTGATKYEWTTDKAEDNTPLAFDVYFVDANGGTVFSATSTSGIVGSGVDFSKVAKVYTKAKVNNWLAYKDNKVYNGKLTIKNATGHILATLNVTFKKVLPTAPEGFSVKTNQIGSDGIYRCYLEPNDWEAPNATQGTMSLDQVFNFGTGTLARYETTFAASKPKTGGGHDPIVVTGDGMLSVGRAYIDNTTQHATTVVYNYGKISTETKGSNGSVIDFKATIKEFPTIYSNIYNNTYSWRWATRADLGLAASASLPYSTTIEYGSSVTVNLAHIYGVSTRDSKYNAFLDAPYLNSLQVTGAKLVSNSNNLDEYFNAALSGTTISLTEKSGSTNPTDDVPSTLVITAKDMYNNDVEIRLPMTVKKR